MWPSYLLHKKRGSLPKQAICMVPFCAINSTAWILVAEMSRTRFPQDFRTISLLSDQSCKIEIDLSRSSRWDNAAMHFIIDWSIFSTVSRTDLPSVVRGLHAHVPGAAGTLHEFHCACHEHLPDSPASEAKQLPQCWKLLTAELRALNGFDNGRNSWIACVYVICNMFHIHAFVSEMLPSNMANWAWRCG